APGPLVRPPGRCALGQLQRRTPRRVVVRPDHPSRLHSVVAGPPPASALQDLSSERPQHRVLRSCILRAPSEEHIMIAGSAYIVLAVSLVVLGVAPAHGQAQSYGYPGYSPYAYSPYYSPPVYSAPAGQYPRPLGSWYTSPFATSGAYPRPIGSWYTTPLGGSASYPRPIGSWYTTPFPVYNTYTPGYSYSPYSGSYSDSSSPSAPPAAQ